jgi:hypothetical protein
MAAIGSVTALSIENLRSILRTHGRRRKKTAASAVANGTKLLGSGTAVVVALIKAKSPSTRLSGAEGRIVELNMELMLSVDPSFKLRVRGLNEPVRVALVGCGLLPPIGITPPSHESPSGAKVK